MRFTLLTYEYPPFCGGVANYLRGLMQAAPPSVTVDVDVPPAGEYWIKTAWRIYFKLRKSRPDIIAVSHVLPMGYVALKMRFWFKAPYIVFTHGTDILSARRSPWKRLMMRFVLRRAKFVIANSRFTAGLLKEEGIARVEIVPPAVVIPERTSEIQSAPDDRSTDDDGITASAGMMKKTSAIISIGRLVPRKGFDTLIRMLPSIIKEVPSARLVIIGKGDYHEELDRLSHELRVENFVEILDGLSDQEKNERLRHADVFALAARKVGTDIEGFGIVTLEAAVAGLPVVVSRIGGAPEAVIDGVTGIVVTPEDPRALSEALIRLLSSPQDARKMGEEGRKYVTEHYSVEKIADKFWDLLCRPSTHSG
jgi:phosphatidyl-myo-inositol dimannoside synthase